MFPALPEERAAEELYALTGQILAESNRLAGSAMVPGIVQAVRPYLRAMNSYYTNRIEGQHTAPIDIERALRKIYSADGELARKQRLAIAHMEAEAELEAASPAPIFSEEAVRSIHRSLYSRLAAEDRLTEQGQAILPGEYRRENVSAGRHVAPEFSEIGRYMHAWQAAYGPPLGGERALIAIACAHHRLVWIHPFLDGNGRTARLHSHLALHQMGLTQGLWSPMRGLARTVERYFARLNDADLPRRSDTDGRGPLSQIELVHFAKYFLETCLDQIRFIGDLLEFHGLKARLRDLLRYLEHHPDPEVYREYTVKIEALEPLHYLALTSELERQRFIQMIGLGARTGRRVLATLLALGLLRPTSSSPRSPVSFSLPMKTLRFVFPRLWPEAE